MLTPTQKIAVETIAKDLCVIACPGAGKTRVVAMRVVEILKTGNAKPGEIVALSYTNKSADELESRIHKYISREIGAVKNLDEMFVGTMHSYCFRLLRTNSTKYASYQLLEGARLEFFVTQNFRGKNLHKFLLANKYFDFDLILKVALEELKNNNEFREAIRGKVRFLTVDEYQDIDPTQDAIIRELHALGANLCVVGDDDQTIYQFRGTSPKNIRRFNKRYPDSERVVLCDNFRSSPGIIKLAKLFTKKDINCASGVLYDDGDITCAEFKTQDDEADFIATKISAMKCDDVAILCRTRRIMPDIVAALTRHKILHITEDVNELFKAVEINNLCECFFYLHKLFPKMYEQYHRDEFFSQRVIRYLDTIDIRAISLKEIYKGIVKLLPDANANVRMFEAVIDDFEEICDTDCWIEKLALFCEFLEGPARDKYELGDVQNKPAGTVRIMTAHSAKGLEFATVFIPNLNDGYFPYYKARTRHEERLFYVALSRAKKRLVLTRSTSRRTRHYHALVSPFYSRVRRALTRRKF